MVQSIQRCGVTKHPKRKRESDFPKGGKNFPGNFWSVGFFKKMTKGFNVDSVEVEMSKGDMKRLIKKYKKLKKFQKSNLHTIETLGGKDTIIEKLIQESDGYEL